jgi:hypothetical protein
MKIRTGFVSNSSSTSFAIIVGKADHERALEGLKAFPKKVMQELNFTTHTFRGEEVLVLNDTFSSEDGFPAIGYNEKIPKSYEEKTMDDILDLYAKELKKIKADFIFDVS